MIYSCRSAVSTARSNQHILTSASNQIEPTLCMGTVDSPSFTLCEVIYGITFIRRHIRHNSCQSELRNRLAPK